MTSSIKTKIKSEKEFTAKMLMLAMLQEKLVDDSWASGDEQCYWALQDECVEYVAAKDVENLHKGGICLN